MVESLNSDNVIAIYGLLIEMEKKATIRRLYIKGKWDTDEGASHTRYRVMIIIQNRSIHGALDYDIVR